jgi:two-component sensor histidine kinase
VGASLLGAIRQSIQPHCPEEPRCSVAGDDIKLSPKTALALTLAVHELATNALKYGAWSDPSGMVTVASSTYRTPDGNGRIRIEWRESGGPPVGPPQRRGFGSTLIERGLSREMGGEVKMEFLPDGLVCIIDAPESPYAHS